MNRRQLFLTTFLLAGWAALGVAQQVSIKGSNTFGEELGPRLIESFTAQRPDWRVDLESRHTGHGIQALLDGECDIAAASRTLNEDEVRLARSRNITLRSHTIGYYGIAVIVNKESKVKNLTDRQVRDIFSGAVKTWSIAGGSDAPITVHISSPAAGTYLGFQELALEKRPYREDAVQHATYAEIARAVSEDRNGIGYIAVSMTPHLPVRAVTINGVAPTSIAVSDDLYPFARLLRFYTAKGREMPAAMEFIRYVRSTEGQNVLEQAGFVRRFQRRLSINMETP
ncbi:MAG TPA: phosphate ABC transporter substrate-binding protein [Kiritimatiellia bacterium]|nr:phosphate ABC transporter substrate-binding protein [Kiritimatiellia bacterium]